MRRVVGGRRRKRSSVAFNWKAFSRFRRAAPRPERLLEVEDDRSRPETETKNKFQCCFTTTEHLVNSSENVFFFSPPQNWQISFGGWGCVPRVEDSRNAAGGRMTHPRAEVIVYSALLETVCFDEKQRRAGNASLPLQLWRVAIGDQLVRTSSGSHRGNTCAWRPRFWKH